MSSGIIFTCSGIRLDLASLKVDGLANPFTIPSTRFLDCRIVHQVTMLMIIKIKDFFKRALRTSDLIKLILFNSVIAGYLFYTLGN